MASIRIEGVSKRYVDDDDHLAVRGVDLDVDDGELLVIVGPSGCGKSSLLRMIAGLEDPSAGTVHIGGRLVTGVERGPSTPAMMFQQPALYPHMTVGENIGFPLRVAGCRRREIDRRVVAVASRLGIADLIDQRPRTLSGGQQQRVAMARAMVRDPAVVLMDEPMSNLDAKLRVELRATIGAMHRELDVTMVYVTHDQVEALALADRLVVMRHGSIVQLGTPGDIYRAPVDTWVATFLGLPAMNLFVADLEWTDGRAQLRVADESWPIAASDEVARETPSGPVVVGVRPQAFRFGDDGSIVDVEQVRRVGDRWVIDASLDAAPVTVTDAGVEIGTGRTPLTIDLDADADTGRPRWRPSHVTVDPPDIHLFDPTSGRSLRRVAADDAQRTRVTT